MYQGTLTEVEGSVQSTSLTWSDQLVTLDYANIIYFFTKQANLMRRSMVPSLPFHLVFPGCTFDQEQTGSAEIEGNVTFDQKTFGRQTFCPLTQSTNGLVKQLLAVSLNHCVG